MTIVTEQRRESSELKVLVETAASVEKLRIQLSNRLSALNRGADESEKSIPEQYQVLFERMQALEDFIDPYITNAVNAYPVWHTWLKHVKGIGPTLAGQMLGLLLPPRLGDDAGSWMKAAGLIPQWREEQGQFRLPRDRKDEPAEHHRYLRRCLYNVAAGFVRTGAGGFYRSHYDASYRRLFDIHCPAAARFLRDWERRDDNQRVVFLETKVGLRLDLVNIWIKNHVLPSRFNKMIIPIAYWRQWAATNNFGGLDPLKEITPVVLNDLYRIECLTPSQLKSVAIIGIDDENWPLWRMERVARWITVKLFLSHLFEEYCETIGLPRPRPYIIAIGGHDESHYLPPPQPNGDGKI